VSPTRRVVSSLAPVGYIAVIWSSARGAGIPQCEPCALHAEGSIGCLRHVDRGRSTRSRCGAADVRDPYANALIGARGAHRVPPGGAHRNPVLVNVAPASYVETNIGGTLNLLEATRAEGVERLVVTSTSETYGTAQYTPIDEVHPAWRSLPTRRQSRR